MLYALSWFVVVALVALWSLAAWALHAAALWTASNAGALAAAASGASARALPDWLVPWAPPDLVPAMTELMAGLEPVINSLLLAVPALAGGVTVVSWVVWGMGGVLLLLLGVGLHLMISLWRRRGGGGSGPNTGPSLAAG